MNSEEINAIIKIEEAMNALPDHETKIRVLKWAVDKFGKAKEPLESQVIPPAITITPLTNDTSLTQYTNELPGIAHLSSDGNLIMTIRDLKASSQNDAAIRLALVAIYAYEKLTGNKSASSRRIITPILQHQRLYNGNTRWAMAHHRGILRDGDSLSLDAPAKREAERYIDEILDDTVKGGWSGSNPLRKKKSNRFEKPDESVNT